MTPDLQTDDDVLGTIADALRDAGGRVGALAESLPAQPNAGDAAALVDAVLANLIGGAGELVDTAAGLWGGIEESRAAYRSAALADAFRGIG